MKKIIVIVEGQTEKIFVRNLLLYTFSEKKISIKCVKLVKDGNDKSVPYDLDTPDPDIHFKIIDAGNDNKVLSVILDRKEGFLREKYELILGLRDMYCEEYKNKSKGKISTEISEAIISISQKMLNEADLNGKAQMHFSIMEIEAWFLAFYRLFQRLNSKLTIKHIKYKLGYNLSDIDPETKFFKPSKEISKILNLASLSYDKSDKIVEKIVGNIKVEDYEEVISQNKVDSFKNFFEQIKQL